MMRSLSSEREATLSPRVSIGIDTISSGFRMTRVPSMMKVGLRADGGRLVHFWSSATETRGTTTRRRDFSK